MLLAIGVVPFLLLGAQAATKTFYFADVTTQVCAETDNIFRVRLTNGKTIPDLECKGRVKSGFNVVHHGDKVDFTSHHIFTPNIAPIKKAGGIAFSMPLSYDGTLPSKTDDFYEFYTSRTELPSYGIKVLSAKEVNVDKMDDQHSGRSIFVVPGKDSVDMLLVVASGLHTVYSSIWDFCVYYRDECTKELPDGQNLVAFEEKNGEASNVYVLQREATSLPLDPPATYDLSFGQYTVKVETTSDVSHRSALPLMTSITINAEEETVLGGMYFAAAFNSSRCDGAREISIRGVGWAKGYVYDEVRFQAAADGSAIKPGFHIQSDTSEPIRFKQMRIVCRSTEDASKIWALHNLLQVVETGKNYFSGFRKWIKETIAPEASSDSSEITYRQLLLSLSMVVRFDPPVEVGLGSRKRLLGEGDIVDIHNIVGQLQRGENPGEAVDGRNMYKAADFKKLRQTLIGLGLLDSTNDYEELGGHDEPLPTYEEAMADPSIVRHSGGESGKGKGPVGEREGAVEGGKAKRRTTRRKKHRRGRGQRQKRQGHKKRQQNAEGHGRSRKH